MATDLTDIIQQGYMKCKSRSLGLWQKRWIILRRSSQKGPCRLEKYLNEYAARNADQQYQQQQQQQQQQQSQSNNQQQQQQQSQQNHRNQQHNHQYKIQLLTNVISIDRLSNQQKRHAFQIEFNDGSIKYFACESDLDADRWVKSIIQQCFLSDSNNILSGEPDILKPGIQKELLEQFKVYLMPSTKLDIFGECYLQITHENIYLWDILNPKQKLCAWPLTALRRYGSDLTKFTFEAGRHCVTGEGMFIFHTMEGEKIYRKVHQATLTIAEAHQRMKKHQHQQPQQLTQQSNNAQQQHEQQQLNSPSTPTSLTKYVNNNFNNWYNHQSNSDNESINSSISTSSSSIIHQHHHHQQQNELYNRQNNNLTMGLDV